MSDRALTAPSGDANSPGYVQVSVDPSGNVGIWTREPMTLAHVHSDEPSRPATVHASGKTAALSFTDQRKGLAWDSGVAGERWELRSEQRTARLWTPSTGDVARFEHNGAVTLPGTTSRPVCATIRRTSRTVMTVATPASVPMTESRILQNQYGGRTMKTTSCRLSPVATFKFSGQKVSLWTSF